MKNIKITCLLGIVGTIFLNSFVKAQVVPDGTLPNQSQVSINSDRFWIDGGTPRGGNLFHSFENFSVPLGRSVYFNNLNNIKNIFTRVTGSSVSQIDGVLEANGNANLFLINPKGIIFGNNAALNLGGSFLASTAERIQFKDGISFSAKAPELNLLLTSALPVGLQVGNNPGSIAVMGAGRELIILAPLFTPVMNAGTAMTGLRVKNNNSLILLGGNIEINGGILTASGGQIELGSAENHYVLLKHNEEGWSLGSIPSGGNINLVNRAWVDASGTGNSSIRLQGQDIKLSEGSILLIQNQGSIPSRGIEIQSSNLLLENTNTALGSGLLLEALSTATSGNVLINTNKLQIFNGSAIASIAYGNAPNGDINVRASQSIEVVGFSPASIISKIVLINNSSTEGGSLTLFTPFLSVRNGGSITNLINSSGSGKDSVVNANTVELIGIEPITFQPSIISSGTFNAGNAGNLRIYTEKLKVLDGARVTSSTLGSGDAGNLILNAGSILVSGTAPGAVNPSLIDASANRVDETLQNLFRLPPFPSGNSGNIMLSTGSLIVKDGALVSVKNDGTGNGGVLDIRAGAIILDRAGGITASTQAGVGGNLSLTTDTIQLRHQSFATATAGGSGDGGNLTIDAKTVVALEGSAITANAILGNGGNIQINAQGMFASPNTAITASSELGVDGAVEINTFGSDPRNALIPGQTILLNPDEAIARSCLTRRNVEQGSFVIMGTGGLPTNPFSGVTEWDNLSGEVQGTQEPSLPPPATSSTEPVPQEALVEANALIVTADGRPQLVAMLPALQSPDSLVCSPPNL